MMTDDTLRRYNSASPADVEEALERSEFVYFDPCPIDLPPADDLELLRTGLPAELKAKNISYHPESDSVPRFDAPEPVRQRVEDILRRHGQRVEAFLRRTLPDYVDGWTVGTTSFRPVEEQGRKLKARSSNELVHIDAGAYGATNGARILRFFVNVNTEHDRIWGTKGGFAELMSRHEELWHAARGGKARVSVHKSVLDAAYSRVVGGLSTVYPLARVIDSSPYDRAMRRIHNYMKESADFRASAAGYREVRFPPMTAWMVFTDGVSHCVLRGQHALVTTLLVPLRNCRLPDIAPFRILEARSEAAGR
jgi:hypothetical protein